MSVFSDRVAAGICGRCGNEPMREGKTECEGCAKKRALQYKERVLKAIQAGVCFDCGRPATGPSIRCFECSVKANFIAKRSKIRRYLEQRGRGGG